MLVPVGEFYDLSDLCFRNVVRENAADADTVTVYMQHDLDRRFSILVEYLLKDVHDKFHRRVVIVENENLIETRFFGLGTRFCDGSGGVVTVPCPLATLALTIPSVFHRRLSQTYIGTLILIDKGCKQSLVSGYLERLKQRIKKRPGKFPGPFSKPSNVNCRN